MEALQRAKLLMKYDTKKTLTENINMYEAGGGGRRNQRRNPTPANPTPTNPTPPTERSPRKVPGLPADHPVNKGIKTIQGWCNTISESIRKNKFVGGKNYGLRAALICSTLTGIGSQIARGIYKYFNIDSELEAKIATCDTIKSSEFKPMLTPQEHDKFAEQVNKAIHPFGTMLPDFADELDFTDTAELGLPQVLSKQGTIDQGVFKVLERAGNFIDLCRVRDSYNRMYESSFEEDLSGDLSGPEIALLLKMISKLVEKLPKDEQTKIVTPPETTSATPDEIKNYPPCIQSHIKAGFLSDFTQTDNLGTYWERYDNGVTTHRYYKDGKVAIEGESSYLVTADGKSYHIWECNGVDIGWSTTPK